ncbi:putative transporter, partial [Smittium mucronatum]
MSKFAGRSGSLIRDLEEQMEQEPVDHLKSRSTSNQHLDSLKKSARKTLADSPKPSLSHATESSSLLGSKKDRFVHSNSNLHLADFDIQSSPGHSVVEGLDLVDSEEPGIPGPEELGERKLGTLEGVFIPTTLSIFGVIVFVRLGYTVGQAGVLLSLVLFLFGYVVTISTTLSISAIATNGTVKGSIGIMFYAGTMLAGALNVVAFIEPFLNNFGKINGDVSQIFPESKLFAKANSIFSTFIGLSVISILLSFFLKSPFQNPSKNIYYTGLSYDTLMSNLWPDFSVGPNGESETFGKVFGVMFPACVGIMAGASMSGSLKNPSQSIPKGTLYAIALTMVTYLSMVVLLGSSTSRVSLKLNMNVLQEINFIKVLVPIGAISTSITSTLSGIIASSAILQAIARDDLFNILSIFKQVGGSEATYAVIGTYLLSQMVMLYGDVNSVASYVTLFNLLMFASTNFALFVLKSVGATNFRPTFQYFNLTSALIGVVSSLAAMLMVDVDSTIVTIVIMGLLMWYVHRYVDSKDGGQWPHNWGSIGQGLIYHQVRKYILQLDKTDMHIKYWRPQILLLLPPIQSYPKNSTESGVMEIRESAVAVGSGTRGEEFVGRSLELTSKNLIRVGNLLKKGGLYIIGQVVVGKFRDCLELARESELQLVGSIEKKSYKGFVSVAIAKNFQLGARTMVMGSGLGGMRPNIVIFKAGRTR